MIAHGHRGISHSYEVAKTVMEVADVAWTALEKRHNHHAHEDHGQVGAVENHCPSLEEDIRSENRRLRSLLEQNLKLLQGLVQSPLLKDCPPDLYVRILAAVNSKKFLTELELLHRASIDGTANNPPLDGGTGETMINVNPEEPSWWVWVPDEMALSNVEEWSGIDNESYVVINEEQVVDGVANFVAKCILSNPKSKDLTPEELQKTVDKALSSMSKFEKIMNIWHAGTMFYALATWGIALAGLCWPRTVLKVAAKGLHASSKVVMRTL